MGDEAHIAHRFPPASRRADPPTAKRAGDRVEARSWSKLHLEVLEWLRVAPMTDKDLENLPQFKHRYSPSTVRKRRSELFKAGRLASVGERDGLQVWRVVG